MQGLEHWHVEDVLLATVLMDDDCMLLLVLACGYLLMKYYFLFILFNWAVEEGRSRERGGRCGVAEANDSKMTVCENCLP